MKVYRDVKYLKSLINVEFKRLDFQSSQLSPNQINAATPIFMTGLTQGDGATHRDGNSVRLKSLYFQMEFERNATATKPGTRFRIMIIKSTYNNNVLPALSDILAQSSNFMSPLNIDETAGFRVLKDQHFTVTVDKPMLSSRFRINLNHHAKYIGTSDAVSDATSGHLFLMAFVGDSANADYFQYNSRIRYVDN